MLRHRRSKDLQHEMVAHPGCLICFPAFSPSGRLWIDQWAGAPLQDTNRLYLENEMQLQQISRAGKEQGVLKSQAELHHDIDAGRTVGCTETHAVAEWRTAGGWHHG